MANPGPATDGGDLIAVIDLGEVPARHEFEETAPRPQPQRRWPLVALVLALALAVQGASAAPPRPLPMAVLATRTGSTVAIGDHAVFVAEPGEPGVYRQVAAYRLTDRTQLWRVDVPIGGDLHQVVAVDDILVLTSGEMDAGRPSVSTVGLDASTGAQRWRHAARFDAALTGGRVLLSAQAANSAGDPAAADPAGTGQTLSAVRAETGQVVWSFDLPADAMRAYRFDGKHVDLIAVVLPVGRLEVHEVDGGKLVRSRQIAAPAAAHNPAFVEIVGDLLLLRSASATTAYGLDRLDLKWWLPLAAGFGGSLVPCGAPVCFEAGGVGLTVVDPVTGRRKWSNPRWSAVIAEAGGYLITSTARRDDQIVVAVDRETGRVRRELGSWQEVHADAGGDRIIGIRYELTRAVVALLEPARGTRILGVLHDVLYRSCWTASSRLLCWRTDASLGIWQLPDRPTTIGGRPG